MKIVFLNLPNKKQVIRRYMCSYNAPNFLFPPLELMYLASATREWNQAQVWIIDAIAKKWRIKQVEQELHKIAPDLVVFLSGFEIFQEDMQAVAELQSKLASAKFAVFGYLPTLFAEQVLSKTEIDFCLMDEPEITLSELCVALAKPSGLEGIAGLAWKRAGRVVVNSRRPRIRDLDKLPFPARDLLDNDLYGEPMLSRPFTLIQSARGCPFSCTYCVRSFGAEFVSRSAENIIAEIEQCLTAHGIKNFRFIDDTFNATKDRSRQISQLILDQGWSVKWTALSRADTLDLETLKLMRRAGCRRLYIGIESGSQKILDLYRKGYQIDKIKQAVQMVHNSGMESVGFFMVGAPGENEQDLKMSIALAKQLNFDFIAVFKAVSYPGTPLFDQHQEQIEFSLFPYLNRLKDRALEQRYAAWEKRFYREYYFRPGYVARSLIRLFKNPVQSVKGLIQVSKYLLTPTKQESRQDLI
ncbi:B12-binding domain-containing radical SAM protein [Candidatus Omnitrophota bacterium]